MRGKNNSNNINHPTWDNTHFIERLISESYSPRYKNSEFPGFTFRSVFSCLQIFDFEIFLASKDVTVTIIYKSNCVL